MIAKVGNNSINWRLCRSRQNFNFRILLEKCAVIDAGVNDDIDFLIIGALARWAGTPPDLRE